MRAVRISAILAFALLIISARTLAAQESVLFSFGGTGGSQPMGSLVADAAGNLYGTTDAGNIGNIFELTPTPDGGWSEQVLHTFHNTTSDGRAPVAGLILDVKGNLYGTTTFGGANGRGTVFELMPNGDGTWTEQLLYSFGAETSTDGQVPYDRLIFDKKGNLYGTTEQGGAYSSYGTVFELSPSAGGVWTETVLYNFGSPVDTGVSPYAGLTFDANGNLYGATSKGGSRGAGTVFELSPATSGNWTETVLYNFGANATDARSPQGDLIFDAHGNLYSTTTTGGTYGAGTAFELSPATNNAWTENVLFSFGGAGAASPSGIYPQAGLVLDASGNLYGTNSEAGTDRRGIVFKLSPSESGSWTENVLCDFPAAGNVDGEDPNGGLIFDAAGNLYGTTVEGGANGAGTVFEIQSPNATTLTLSLQRKPANGRIDRNLHSYCNSHGGSRCADGTDHIDNQRGKRDPR